MKTGIAIIGASGHAKVIIEIIEEMGGCISYVIDINNEVTTILGYDVTNNLENESPVIVAIGDNMTRRKVVNTIFNEFSIAIHPKATISKRCKVLDGTVIMAGVSINSESTIGRHCIINTNASVDHDCIIGDFVHISPNASLAGNVRVGEGTHIGIGSTVIQGIEIGKWAIIGAGAAIINHVPDYAVVLGVPGVITKFRKPIV